MKKCGDDPRVLSALAQTFDGSKEDGCLNGRPMDGSPYPGVSITECSRYSLLI